MTFRTVFKRYELKYMLTLEQKEMKELLGYMARHHEDLEKSFSDEQKKRLKSSTIVGASI